MEKLQNIKKKIIRKHVMSHLQEAVYHKKNGDDARALICLGLVAMHSGEISKNPYSKGMLDRKTKWNKNHLLMGIVPSVMFTTKLRGNWMQWLGLDIDTYSLTNDEKDLVNSLED